MELEHTNLGSHCEVSDCNERDFLPFKCDVCSKNFCLLHRTYAAHSCSGANAKDMTSLDCPICGKSVKFSKAESPDIVWDQHYMTSCAGVQSNNKAEKCNEQSCYIKLGPSNTFKCPKCNQNVCLSHRFPEDHKCKGMRGTTTDPKQSQRTADFVPTKPTNMPNYSPPSTTSSRGSDVFVAAKGGAGIISGGAAKVRAVGSGQKAEQSTHQKGQIEPTSSGPPSDSFSCLFCNLGLSDARSGNGSNRSGSGDCTIS